MDGILKIGLAGLGAIGRTHVDRINGKLRRAQVVGVTDLAPEYGKKAAAGLGLPFHESAQALLDSGVDALMVTASDPDHEAYVLAAIKAGKPVFCEKPLAPDAEACQRVIDAEMATGRMLVQVGFMRRYDPGYRQLKEMIDGGKYGAPLMMHCAHRNPEVPEAYTTPMAITNTLIHEIDTLRWLIGEDYDTVEMAFPKATKYTHPNLRDPQIMILTSKSGVRMDVECFVNCRVGYDIQCEVCCEDGIFRLPELASVPLLHDAKRTTTICNAWSERFVEAYNVEIQEWIDSTLAGRVDGPSSWDGLVACVTADAAQQARETGKPVKVALPEMPSFYKRG
jgi:Predicted dehydrogenases and related proteins